MGQHTEDAMEEELRRAVEFPGDEPVHPLFALSISTEENIDNELARLMNYF